MLDEATQLAFSVLPHVTMVSWFKRFVCLSCFIICLRGVPTLCVMGRFTDENYDVEPLRLQGFHAKNHPNVDSFVKTKF